jgi:hypothetical protein
VIIRKSHGTSLVEALIAAITEAGVDLVPILSRHQRLLQFVKHE